MHPTDKASEPQLRDYDKAGVIKSARIIKTQAGFVVVIRLTWKPGDVVLHSQRGGPRAWVSLDRLLKYLDDIAPTIRQIDLVLTEPPEIAELAKPARRGGPAKTAAKKAAAKKTVRTRRTPAR